MAASLNNNDMLALPENQYTQQPAIRRGPGRRKSKTGGGDKQKKKKQIMRGMGVEKLERLREAEENSGNPSLAAAAFDDTGLMVNVSGYGGNRNFPYLGGFGSQNAVRVGHMGLGFNRMATGHVVLEGHEISKKKRYTGVGDVGFFDSRVMDPDRVNIHQFGLNVGGNANNTKLFPKQENHGLFDTPSFKQMVPQVGYATRPGRPGVEVLAVQKRGGANTSTSGQGNGKFMMEYEFFPGSKRNKEDHEELKMKKEAEEENGLLMMMKKDSSKYCAAGDFCLGIGVGTSSTTTSSSSIDLSLKLSYD